ncbi:MAG: tetratricopeptide repeat protein, partial [Bacteriovoracaceae bacterium]
YMAQEPQPEALDETLKRTDLGQIINDNKKPILIAGLVVLLAIVAFSIYRYQANQQESQNLEQIYAFKNATVQPYLEDKISSDEAVEKILALGPELTGSPNLAPAIFEVANKLQAKDQASAAISILRKWFEQHRPGSYLYFFTGLRLAPLYEDANQPDKAIGVYEGLVKGNYDILQGKIYLDLGRLHLEQNEMEKAKSFFDHVIKNHEDTEYAKFARLYLQRSGL